MTPVRVFVVNLVGDRAVGHHGAMRIGVLGVGRIGRAHAANLTLVARSTGGRPRPRADALAGLPGRTVTSAASADEVLERCDGVVVGHADGPPPGRRRAGTDAGLPCLCEKPLSLDLAASQTAVAYADRRHQNCGRLQRRFDPGFVEMRRLIEAALGRLACCGPWSRLPAAHEALPPQAGSIFRDMHPRLRRARLAQR